MKRAGKGDIMWFRNYGHSVYWYVTNSSEFTADDFCEVMLHFGF